MPAFEDNCVICALASIDEKQENSYFALKFEARD